MYNILSITSFSGVGKTTLIENVVRILTNRGYKIGTIKHTCHDVDFDRSGKDSYKHRQAGASKVCVVSSNRICFIEESKKEKKLSEIIQLYSDMDLIIVEGYKNYKFKKIEVIRKDLYENIISDKDDLIGIVSDTEIDLNINKFKLDEYDNIATYIESCLKNEKLIVNQKWLDTY